MILQLFLSEHLSTPAWEQCHNQMDTFFLAQHLKLLATPAMNWKVLPSSLAPVAVYLSFNSSQVFFLFLSPFSFSFLLFRLPGWPHLFLGIHYHFNTEVIQLISILTSFAGSSPTSSTPYVWGRIHCKKTPSFTWKTWSLPFCSPKVSLNQSKKVFSPQFFHQTASPTSTDRGSLCSPGHLELAL